MVILYIYLTCWCMKSVFLSANRCVHSYYHLAPLVCCYCSKSYLSNSVDYSCSCSLSGLPTLVCFHVFHRLMMKHLVLLTDVVSGFKSFSEARCLARKCGTRRSDSPVRAL
jgi:hypothetical protein